MVRIALTVLTAVVLAIAPAPAAQAESGTPVPAPAPSPGQPSTPGPTPDPTPDPTQAAAPAATGGSTPTPTSTTIIEECTGMRHPITGRMVPCGSIIWLTPDGLPPRREVYVGPSTGALTLLTKPKLGHEFDFLIAIDDYVCGRDGMPLFTSSEFQRRPDGTTEPVPIGRRSCQGSAYQSSTRALASPGPLTISSKVVGLSFVVDVARGTVALDLPNDYRNTLGSLTAGQPFDLLGWLQPVPSPYRFFGTPPITGSVTVRSAAASGPLTVRPWSVAGVSVSEISGVAPQVRIPAGPSTMTIEYSGDANWEPATFTLNVFGKEKGVRPPRGQLFTSEQYVIQPPDSGQAPAPAQAQGGVQPSNQGASDAAPGASAGATAGSVLGGGVTVIPASGLKPANVASASGRAARTAGTARAIDVPTRSSVVVRVQGLAPRTTFTITAVVGGRTTRLGTATADARGVVRIPAVRATRPTQMAVSLRATGVTPSFARIRFVDR